MIEIYVDNRERNEIILKILKKKCKVIEKRLDIADFLLSNDVAVERKTISDFLQSIIDRRLFDQVNRIKTAYKKPIVMIEGDMSKIYELRKIHPNSVRGAMATIFLDLKVPIIYTSNSFQTAEMLVFIARKEQEPNKNGISIRSNPKFRSMNQMQEYIIAGLPGINEKLAKRMLKYFGSPEKIFTADESELMKVDGLGRKKIAKLRNILSKKYEPSILED